MKTTIATLEKSIFWQRHVYQQSKNPAQKERAKTAIAKMEAEIKDLRPHHPDCPAVDGFGCHCDK